MGASTMFARWPGFVLQSPSVRRPLIRLWRMLLRVQRASVATAVLVVRRQDGRVLALASPSGDLSLPNVQLDAWIPVGTQVEMRLAELHLQRSAPSLVAVHGTPGPQGVIFVYAATTERALGRCAEEVWLEPDAAASGLGSEDRRLLKLSASELRSETCKQPHAK